MSEAVREYRIDIPQAALDDLKARLSVARFPEKETVGDWSQGIPLATVERFTDYWRDEYDWRRCEKRLNQYPQFVTEIDGVDIVFLHIKSPEAEARPLLLTHGWPGSIIEFLNVIGPLSDPTAHGGEAKDAYHLVIPCLPGYGFSGKPSQTGWSAEKIAEAWHELMTRLGYNRWFAQGGDWGGMITSAIGSQDKGGCAGVHVNLVVVGPPSAEIMNAPTEEEQAALIHFAQYQTQGAGYAEIQRTKPQTLGFALADSPVGQMAWIIEKFHGWSDDYKVPEEAFDMDLLLDNVMLYWLTNSGASSARLYWHSFGEGKLDVSPINIPSAATIFPGEIVQPSRRWAEQRFKNLVHFEKVSNGGHFAAMEVPDLFVSEVRAAFRGMEL